MADTNGRYPPHPRATVNRYRVNAKYDYGTIHKIVDTATVVHVAFPPSAEEPFPAVLPMIGCTGDYAQYGGNEELENDSLDDAPKDLYLHGYISGRMQRLSTNPDEAEGLPATVCATHVDGIVIAMAPFHNSFNYRSAVVNGYITPVTDHDERMYAMKRITNSVLKDQWENSRQPPTPTEDKTTGLMKIRIVSASAKVRRGGPNDDRSDLKNDALRKKLWTGVVPVFESYGKPVPTDTNMRSDLPPHIKNAVETRNQVGLAEALDAMKKPAKH